MFNLQLLQKIQNQPSILSIKYSRESNFFKILIIFIGIIVQGSCFKLVYENFLGDFSLSNIDWKIIKKDSTSIIDIYEVQQNLKMLRINNQQTQYNALLLKSFNLEPHYRLTISFKLWKFFDWNNNNFLLYSDSQIIINDYLSVQSNQIYTDQIYKTFQHNRPSVQIVIFFQSGIGGISEFQLFIDDCKFGCESCDSFGCLNQILAYKSFTQIYIETITIEEGWSDQSMTKKVDFCNDLYYQQPEGQYLTKTLFLQDHQAISLKLRVLILNSSSTQITVKIDDRVVENYSYSQGWIPYTHSDKAYDGVWYHQTEKQIDIFQYQHSKSFIIIRVNVATSNPIYTSWAPWFGIRDFQLFIQPTYICNDNNLNPFDGCFSNFYDCTLGCKNCVKDICVECLNGWKYIQATKTCQPLCGDSIITYDEECDDGNNNQFDGCHNCKFQCSQFCTICQFGKCLDFLEIEYCSNCLIQVSFYYKHKDNSNVSCIDFQEIGKNAFDSRILSNNCLNKDYYTVENLIYKEIIISQTCDFFFDTYTDIKFSLNYYIQKSKTLISTCGNILDIYEVCNDNNNQQFDGCYKCQQSCQIECQNCIYGQCYHCFEGWSLVDGICYQICGDGLLAEQSIEQCDNVDSNECIQCLFQCSPYCLYCLDQLNCAICQINFNLVGQQCISICGDSIKIEGLEECDDGNDIPYDGCYQCQYQCELDCILCIDGKCLKKQINDEQNQQIDEEQIIALTFIQNCSLIYENKCKQCNQQYTLVNGTCIQCGNFLKELNEECDDGNIINNDGCSSSCSIEEGWNCTTLTFSPSTCYQITKPLLTYIEDIYDLQYVGLSYNQKVKLLDPDQDYQNEVTFFINNLESNQYKISVQPVTKIDYYQFSQINYKITIQYLEKIHISPKLIVLTNGQLLDENENLVLPNSLELELNQPQILDSIQMKTANNSKILGKTLLLTLSGFGGIMLISGQIFELLNILDILQYQSILKYINVNYPQNLQIYFQSSDMISIQPILMNFKILDIFNSLLNEYILESQDKFKYYQLNADLITNIYGQLSQIVLYVLSYIILLHFYKIFVPKNCFTARYFYYARLCNSRIISYCAIKIYYFYKRTFKFLKTLNAKKFIPIFHANSLDILFKVMLFLVSTIKNDYRQQISTIISILILILMVFILIRPVRKIHKTEKLKNIKQQQHESITLLRQFLFVIILMVVQKHPLLQCLLLFFNQLLFISCLSGSQFSSSFNDLVMILWLEIPILIFTLINISFCKEVQNFLSQRTQDIIGFIQIGLLILGILGPTIKFASQFIKKIKFYLSKCLKDLSIKNAQKKAKILNQF